MTETSQTSQTSPSQVAGKSPRARMGRFVWTRKRVFVAIGVALAALLAFRLYGALMGGGGPGGPGGPRGRGAGPRGQAQPVEVAEAQKVDLQENVTLVGSLRAKERVDLAPKVGGRLVDASAAGVGLVLDAPLEVGSRPPVLLHLADAKGARHEVAAQVEVRSCREAEGRWLVGATILDIDPDARMRLMEWCYVVCSHERLRGRRPAATALRERDAILVPLPAPSLPQASAA